jgi:hypothetical protein
LKAVEAVVPNLCDIFDISFLCVCFLKDRKKNALSLRKKKSFRKQ